MFSNNQKISLRQIKRLLLFDLFGAGSLLLPARLAAAGTDIGLWCIPAGACLAAVYLWLLHFCTGHMRRDYLGYLAAGWGSFAARLFYIGYALISVLACAWAAGVLAELICESLLDSREFPTALLLIVLLAFYGSIAGLEARARVYEVMFWVLVIPLAAMLLLCIRQVRASEWFPIFARADKEGFRRFLDGTFRCFAAFLPVTFLLFLKPHVQGQKKTGRVSFFALAFSAAALFVLYLILLGIFGDAALAQETYPVITLMGMVKIPGDFIKRLDAVMTGVWFFTLYALIGTTLYYGVIIMREAFRKGRKEGGKTDKKILNGWFLAAAGIVYAAAYGFHTFLQLRELAVRVFYLAGIPFLVLVPAVSAVLCKKKAAVMLVICCSLFLGGCGGAELENKSFPLAVLAGREDDRYQVWYLSQELSEVSNENADAGNMTAVSAYGSTYYEAQKVYEKNNRCQLDLSHTKALVFQEDFIENDSLGVFLETARRENMFARNTLVYLTDTSQKKLAELNASLDVPLGSYLEQTMENEQDMKEQAVVTLSTLLNEQANVSRTLLLPILKEEGGLPVIHAYQVLQNFKPKGRIGVEEARIYYLIAGQLQQMDLYLKDGGQVRLSNLTCRRDFTLKDGRIIQQLSLKADALQITGTAAKEEIEKLLEDNIEEACHSLQAEKQADLTDSRRYLAVHEPDVYRQYENAAEQYCEKMHCSVRVRLRMDGQAGN